MDDTDGMTTRTHGGPGVQPVHMVYSSLGRTGSVTWYTAHGTRYMVHDTDKKKPMKRPVPVNMLLKRVFLLSAESS